MPDIVLDDFDELQSVYDDLSEEINNVTFKEHFERSTIPFTAAVHSEYFSRSAGPSGPWAPWKFRSLDAPEEHNTLIASQRLAFSLQPGSRPDHVEEISESELVYGTSVEYASIHNEGATITTGVPLISRDKSAYIPAGTQVVIPQREFVGFSAPDTEFIVDQLADYIVAQL